MSRSKKSKRPITPLLLSATVCPGLGQLHQGRRFIGSLYIIAILIPACVFAFNAARAFVGWLASLWPFLEETAFPWLINVSARDVLIPLAVTLIVYLLNIADILYSTRKSPEDG